MLYRWHFFKTWTSGLPSTLKLQVMHIWWTSLKATMSTPYVLVFMHYNEVITSQLSITHGSSRPSTAVQPKFGQRFLGVDSLGRFLPRLCFCWGYLHECDWCRYDIWHSAYSGAAVTHHKTPRHIIARGVKQCMYMNFVCTFAPSCRCHKRKLTCLCLLLINMLDDDLVNKRVSCMLWSSETAYNNIMAWTIFIIICYIYIGIFSTSVNDICFVICSIRHY